MTVEVNGVTVTDAALTQLVVNAAQQVRGVHVRRKRVEVKDDAVVLSLTAPYGAVLPDLARDVQERVAGAFRVMCATELASVDVTVEELE